MVRELVAADSLFQRAQMDAEALASTPAAAFR
jgi:hypothetical protein